ncbi:cleavage polyadenylation factor subunit fip1 [Tritrichomonas musculus]|uniref:Cleavage polyadenylation factor subunit fip1 n=1 Tax=Tritrichomonas musculus TaxID=1915356 RepID=A0ABR2KQB3_9EUKA
MSESDKNKKNIEEDSDDDDDDDDDDDESNNQNNSNTNANNGKGEDNDDDDNDEEEDDDDDDDDESNEEEEELEASEDDEITVTMQDNIVQNAAIDAAKRRYHNQVHQTPTGNIAAMRTPQEIFSLGNRIPWELVNPMGVHPKDSTKSIFNYDISALPNTVEARPWTAPDVDPSDWFNYGFNEVTWEKYRKKMLKVIKNKKYESKIIVLSEQTK